MLIVNDDRTDIGTIKRSMLRTLPDCSTMAGHALYLTFLLFC